MKSLRPKMAIFFITGLTCGILVGTAGLSALISYRIDTYHQKIRQLETVIEEKSTKLQKLEESINKRKFILKDIEISLLYEGYELDKIEIEKSIKEKYMHLLGKEVKSIDVDMAVEVIDKRILKIQDREYRLRMNRLMLSDILKIWVKVEPAG
ncbi:MAG: hypothetical protein N3B21_11675 [Clostridia bacterium]|nr:hypothetical protein [Clostridia bacterium]